VNLDWRPHASLLVMLRRIMLAGIVQGESVLGMCWLALEACVRQVPVVVSSSCFCLWHEAACGPAQRLGGQPLAIRGQSPCFVTLHVRQLNVTLQLRHRVQGAF
jgi:hypothetical protein